MSSRLLSSLPESIPSMSMSLHPISPVLRFVPKFQLVWLPRSVENIWLICPLSVVESSDFMAVVDWFCLVFV